MFFVGTLRIKLLGFQLHAITMLIANKKGNKMKIKKELETVWNFSHLLAEIAAPVLLVIWSQEKDGLFHNMLIVAAAVMAVNAMVVLYTLIRK